MWHEPLFGILVGGASKLAVWHPGSLACIIGAAQTTGSWSHLKPGPGGRERLLLAELIKKRTVPANCPFGGRAGSNGWLLARCLTSGIEFLGDCLVARGQYQARDVLDRMDGAKA